MARKYRREGAPKYRKTIQIKVKPTTYRRKGMLIHRKGYTYTRTDVGKPGKGPSLITIAGEGSLTKHGYSTKKSATARRRALRKAIDEYGSLSVFRKLKAQEALRERTQPDARRVFASDAEWVRRHFKTDGFEA